MIRQKEIPNVVLEYYKQRIPEKIKFVDSRTFHDPNAHRVFDAAMDSLPKVSTIETLNIKQEVELFGRYNYAKYRAARLLKKKKKTKITYAAIRWWLAKASYYSDIIASHNKSLAFHWLNKIKHRIEYVYGEVDEEEMLSDIFYAIAKCTESYEFDRGLKFSTYASRAIINDVYRRQRERTVKRFMNNKPIYSLDYEIDTESKEPYVVEVPDTSQIEDREKKERRKEIRKIYFSHQHLLTPDERIVLSDRFALHGKEPKTLNQVSKRLRLSKERIRQLELSGLKKMKIPFAPLMKQEGFAGAEVN